MKFFHVQVQTFGMRARFRTFSIAAMNPQEAIGAICRKLDSDEIEDGLEIKAHEQRGPVVLMENY